MSYFQEQKGSFLAMLLGALVASLLRNMLAGKGVMRGNDGVIRLGEGVIRGVDGVIWSGQGIIRGGDGVIRAGEGVIRAGQDF